MKVVALGNHALLESIQQTNYDDSLHLARRMGNLWLQGRRAYGVMLARDHDEAYRASSREMRLGRQVELLTMLEILLQRGISDALRIAVWHCIVSILP